MQFIKLFKDKELTSSLQDAQANVSYQKVNINERSGVLNRFVLITDQT